MTALLPDGQYVMSGEEFLSRGWPTGWTVTEKSVAIVFVLEGAPLWASWDDGDAPAVDRCNPDIALLDTAGNVIRPAGPRK